MSATPTVTDERADAKGRLAWCKEQQHDEVAASWHDEGGCENPWCDECDTGECMDCHRPLFYGPDDLYHHIEDPARGCFLIVAEKPGA